MEEAVCGQRLSAYPPNADPKLLLPHWTDFCTLTSVLYMGWFYTLVCSLMNKNNIQSTCLITPAGTHITEAVTWQLISMSGWSPQQVVQETEPGQKGQLENITNKTPSVGPGRIVISPDKVPQVVEDAKIVTAKPRKMRKRQELTEEGSFKHQTSLADFQQFVEIDQNDREEPPKFDPVQESSAYSHEMPPSA